jgi:hypothetical protein
MVEHKKKGQILTFLPANSTMKQVTLFRGQVHGLMERGHLCITLVVNEYV